MGEIYAPYVLQCMHFRHESKSNSIVRTVMDYEFDFCVGCDREMWLDGKRHKIEKGCFVIRKPGQNVSSKGVYDCYMLTLDFSKRLPCSQYSRNTATEMQRSFESDMWDVLPSVFKPSHYEEYLQIFETMMSVNETNINENPQTFLLVNELLHLLMFDSFCRVSATTPIVRTPINEVCAYIKNHYMEEIRLENLASVAHLNKNYLVRQFKKTFGISPIAYLIHVRMEHAKKLLIETDLPVKTIAVSCGYTDPSFFNIYFKKMYSV